MLRAAEIRAYASQSRPIHRVRGLRRSIPSCKAGMATSNMPIGSHSPQSTASFVADCGPCCASSSADRARDDASTIMCDGRIPSSPPLGCSRCPMPIGWRAKPDVETTDWRARRGRTAQRVRREGTAVAVPYPYPMAGQAHFRNSAFAREARQIQTP